MPELPDVLAYLDALRPRVVGQTLEAASITSPFLLRSVDPPIEAAEGRRVRGVSRLGKRIVLELDADLYLVVHLMIAGRLRWTDDTRPARRPRKSALAALRFPCGTLTITEAAPRKRASLHVAAGADAVRAFDRGGVDVLEADRASFARALRREAHILKRALTDPRLFDGIGNAYSDEILHAARLSPFKRTIELSEDEAGRLHEAARDTLGHWILALRRRFDGGRRFPAPGQITAFRPGFAVHGRFGEPCPDCATPVQRVVYAEREMNYCPACQTDGRVLADRSLSRLLRSDWPRTVDELE